MKFGKIVLQVNTLHNTAASADCPLARRAHVTSLDRCIVCATVPDP